MSTITVSVEEALKESLKRKIKEDGVTLTFVVNQALKAYQNGEIQFALSPLEKTEIQKSFQEVSQTSISPQSHKKIKESQSKNISEFIDL